MPPTVTSTSLSTSPPSPVAVNTPIKLTATVTPTVAAGDIQFRDGTSPLGEPVPVLHGTVSGITSRLSVGSHQLTAEFIPFDAAAFAASRSTVVRFVVDPAP
jgi:Bacterial Ig-like domain (group 3)